MPLLESVRAIPPSSYFSILKLVPAAIVSLLDAPSHAVSATWLAGGAGVWSDPVRWSTNPLYACNGQGGNTYDVTLGTGTPTLDLDCTIDSLTQSSGLVEGGFVLQVLGAMNWTGGTQGGTGTTRVGGGLTVSGSSTKFLAGTRTFVQAGGTGSWTLGGIALGTGGATFRNEATWNITGSSRQMTDTSDSGRFENALGGTLNVTLSNATEILTLSPGAIENDGTINANLGIFALDGSGTHNGSFAGVGGTVRFSGGTQTLGPGASATVGDLEMAVTAILNVDPAATYQPGNTDITGGTLNVTDAADTITSGTATQTAGTLGGAGTFATTGSFGWTGGTMGDSGTTEVGGGLTLSGSSTKFLAGTRTLVQTGGTGGWSLGAITLGSGGATFRNESIWNLTGSSRQMTDSSDTGRFENAVGGTLNVTLSDATQILTLSPGAIENDGTINANLGILALDGSGTHNGSFAGSGGTLRFSGGTHTLGPGASATVGDLEVAVTAILNVDPAATYQPGNTDITGGTLNVTNAADTITSGTATQTGGTLGGAGTFETASSFGWTGGTMGDSGTTRVGGGLTASGGSTKFLTGTRTLVQSGGTGGWSLGAITLGNGGATFRNEAIWNITGGGRNLSDTSNTGRFENAPGGTLNVTLTSAGEIVTISAGTVENEGLIDVGLGTLNFLDDYQQTAGALRLSGGRVQSLPPLDIAGGRLEGSGVVDGDVSLAGTLAPGVSPEPSAGQLEIQGTLFLQSAGTFAVDLLGPTRGTTYDTVAVTGATTLGGTLAVAVLEGYRDAVDASTFIVLERTTVGALAGSFTNVASGERVFTSALDSFIVHYGAGSPAGAERVVLSEYVKFIPSSLIRVRGEAAGGTITLEIAGVEVLVATSPGQSRVQVAAAIADAINANAQLRQLGIRATATGWAVASNGEIVVIGDSDPGIEVGPFPEADALSDTMLAVLIASLVGLGLAATRRTDLSGRGGA